MSYFGVPLLYYYENESLNGVLKSYTLEHSLSLDIDSLTKEIASREISQFHPHYRYLGINDIFKVSGKAADGQMLGRTSHYDITTESEAKSLLKGKENYSSEDYSSNGYFNCTMVFFYKDLKDITESFAFTILTLIKAKSLQEAILKAENLSSNEGFLDRIIKSSVDDIDLKGFKFLGFEDFCNIEDDIDAGGAYQTYYSEFESLRQIEQEKLSETKFKELIEILDME